MGLIALRDYMFQVKQASLLDIVTTCQVHPDVVRDMLQRLVKKGVVCQLGKLDGCGSRCTQCDPMFVERYAVVE